MFPAIPRELMRSPFGCWAFVLGINAADSAASNNCTITTDPYAEGDAKKHVTVVADDGYEIVEVKVNGEVQELTSLVFDVDKAATVTAVAAKKVSDAYAYPVVSTINEKVYTAIIKAGGTIKETGVYYGTSRYPAAGTTGITGVQINLGDAEISASDFTTYFMTDANTMYKADWTKVE